MPISVVVASRNPLKTELLCAALKQQRKHFDVVGSAFSSKELLKQVAEHQPQVTLVSADLQDGPTAGLKALRELHASKSGTRPVVLLDSPDLEKVVTAFSAGARGVVYKTSSLRELCKCLRSVHAGQIWADSTQLQWICKTLGEREPVRIVSAKGIPLLTKREAQIAHMVAEGLPNLEISSKLGVSPHTVKNHLFRIYEKLGISNRVELVLYALSSRDGSRESSSTIQGDV
jgi:DNA-binding NarL/FixJ family response regulator